MQSHRFGMIPLIAAKDGRLSKNDYRVLIAIMCNAGKAKRCHPKRETISKDTGLPVSRISEITTRLCKFGWLKKVGNGGRNCAVFYHILTPETDTETVRVTEVVTDTETVSKTDTETVRGKEKTLEKTVNSKVQNGYTGEFEELWGAYPKRAGGNPKATAFTAYKKQRKEYQHAFLLNLVKLYARYCNHNGNTGTEYVKQCSTFFGKGFDHECKWEIPNETPRRLPAESYTDRLDRAEELILQATGRSNENNQTSVLGDEEQLPPPLESVVQG